jgi:hypothetical protein
VQLFIFGKGDFWGKLEDCRLKIRKWLICKGIIFKELPSRPLKLAFWLEKLA